MSAADASEPKAPNVDAPHDITSPDNTSPDNTSPDNTAHVNTAHLDAAGMVLQARDIHGGVHIRMPASPMGVSGLRAPAPEFVGRDLVLRELLEIIDPNAPDAGVAQVAALAGLGGVGKTELAVQVAHEALRRGWFPGGVLAIDLYGYEPARRLDAGTALERLLRRLGVPGDRFPAEVEERAELYRAVLHDHRRQGRPMLVILDNVSPQMSVRDLLPGSGPALVTTRHTLSRLGGRLLDLGTLLPEQSATLLDRQVARKLGGPDPRLTEQDRPGRGLTERPADVGRIVELCAGLPLAVEVVAAVLAAHPRKPLADTVARLEAGRSRLGEVDAALDLSYEDLTERQRRVFRLMTVNPGPQVSTEATAALAGLTTGDALTELESLAEAHLITEGEPYGWWRTHDVIARYAAHVMERHTTPDEADQAYQRLLRYYLKLARAARTHLSPEGAAPRGPFATAAEALDWLDTEATTLIAAVLLPAEGHRLLAVELAAAMDVYLDRRHRYDDAIAVHTSALASARALGDRQGEAQALNDLGLALLEVRRFDAALDALRENLEVNRELGERTCEAQALNNLGLALRETGRADEALAAHRDGLAAYRELGDVRGMAEALNNLGLALDQVGRFGDAVIAYEGSLTAYRRLGDLHREASALSNLGMALRLAGRGEDALAAHRRGLDIARELGDRHLAAMVLTNLGNTLQDLRRSGEAGAAHRQSLTLFRELGERHREARALNNLGAALWTTRRPGDAIAALRESLEILGELGDRREEASTLKNLGVLLAELHRDEEAIAQLVRAQAIYRGLGDGDNDRLIQERLAVLRRRPP